MKPVPFREPSEKDFDADAYGMTFSEYVEMEREDHEDRVSRAQALILQYTADLSAVTGDREAVSRIRCRLREDEEFWHVSHTVVKMVEGEFTWTSSILRAEAKQTARAASEKFEKIRAEREAQRRAEIAAERAELEAAPTFGMF